MSRCRFGFFRGRSQCRETISTPMLFARGLRMQGGTMSYSPGDKSSVSQPQSSEATPGWLARSLFWAALVIGALPSLVLAPMPPLWDSSTDIIFFIVGSILCTCLRLILGAVAILLVKNTNWAHRLLGAGIYLLGCTALMTTPLTWIFLASLGTEGNGALPAMTTIQGALSSIFLLGYSAGGTSLAIGAGGCSPSQSSSVRQSRCSICSSPDRWPRASRPTSWLLCSSKWSGLYSPSRVSGSSTCLAA